jgi:hypothetical protein
MPKYLKKTIPYVNDRKWRTADAPPQSQSARKTVVTVVIYRARERTFSYRNLLSFLILLLGSASRYN